MRRQQEARERAAGSPRSEADRESAARWDETARLANMVVPVGWLPLGVMSAAEGRAWPSLLGLLGMTLIGTASLWRAYRTTVGQYQGQSTNRKGRPAPPLPRRRPRPSEAGRACCSKHGSPACRSRSRPIALAGLRSLLRSPEAKMMLADPADHGRRLRLHVLGRAPAASPSRSGRWSPSGGWASCSSAWCS